MSDISVKLVSLSPGRNRQAADLASALAERGMRVVVYQADADRPERGEFRVSVVPGLAAWKSKRLLGIPGLATVAVCLTLLRSVAPGPADIIVALHFPCLVVGCLISLLKRAPLIYYNVEVSSGWPARVEAYLCRHFASLILGVEENRLRELLGRVKKPIASSVLVNAPRAGLELPKGGALRHYLSQRQLLNPSDKVVLFHGSYQGYSRLEEIVKGTSFWDPDFKLVLMLAGHVPESLVSEVSRSQGRVCVVPPVPQADLLRWVRDAHIGLLAYEDENDFGVRYCSPQKLFDYLVCGIPIIGSPRPLIQKIVSQAQCGMCVCMTDAPKLNEALRAILRSKEMAASLSTNARLAYETTYNYDASAQEALARISALAVSGSSILGGNGNFGVTRRPN